MPPCTPKAMLVRAPLRVIDLMASASGLSLQESQIVLTILLAVYPIILSRINHLRDGNLSAKILRKIYNMFRREYPTAGIRQSSRCPGLEEYMQAPSMEGAETELFKQLTIHTVDEVHRRESVSQHTQGKVGLLHRSFSPRHLVNKRL